MDQEVVWGLCAFSWWLFGNPRMPIRLQNVGYSGVQAIQQVNIELACSALSRLAAVACVECTIWLQMSCTSKVNSGAASYKQLVLNTRSTKCISHVTVMYSCIIKARELSQTIFRCISHFVEVGWERYYLCEDPTVFI